MWQGTVAATSVLIFAGLCLAKIDPELQLEVDVRNRLSEPPACPKLKASDLDRSKPWLVAIIETYPRVSFCCDGAVVHPRAVLGSHVSVKRLVANGTIVADRSQKIAVEKIIRSRSQYPGAAVLVLSEQFVFGDGGKPIPLPDFDYFRPCNCFIVSLKRPYRKATATLVQYDYTCDVDGLVCTSNSETASCKSHGLLVCPVGDNDSDYVLASVQSESATVDEELKICDATFASIPRQRKWINYLLSNISKVGIEKNTLKPFTRKPYIRLGGNNN